MYDLIHTQVYFICIKTQLVLGVCIICAVRASTRSKQNPQTVYYMWNYGQLHGVPQVGLQRGTDVGAKVSRPPMPHSCKLVSKTAVIA